MKVLYVSGAILLAVYAAICALLYFAQDTLVYPPVLESNPPGARLIAAIAPDRRHAVVIPRANHNDISFFPEYQPALKAFVAGR